MCIEHCSELDMGVASYALQAVRVFDYSKDQIEDIKRGTQCKPGLFLARAAGSRAEAIRTGTRDLELIVNRIGMPGVVIFESSFEFCARASNPEGES